MVYRSIYLRPRLVPRTRRKKKILSSEVPPLSRFPFFFYARPGSCSQHGCCCCCYCCCSCSPQNNTQHSREILKGRGRAGRGLLTLILSVIHCSSDKVVGEDQLFKKLHDNIDKRVRSEEGMGGEREDSVQGGRGTRRGLFCLYLLGAIKKHNYINVWVVGWCSGHTPLAAEAAA